MNRTDIYEFDRQMEWAERNLKESDMSEQNKGHIRKFRDYCGLQGFSKPRILKYYRVLKQIDCFLEGKDFDKVIKGDIEKVVAKINMKERWSPATKSDMKILMKRFYKWLLGDDKEYPEQVKWVNSRMKRTERKLPNDGEMLSEDDIDKAIESANNLRDKALISTLYESGCRIGELASLRLRDVAFDKLGTVLSVTGKTGPRKIRIVSSTPYLSNWMNTHPYRKKRDAAVWVCISKKLNGRKMDYDTIRMMIKKVFRRAGIQKRHNPHIFRHSRATFLANHLTEFQMNQYFGWVQGSDMPATYVHLSGREIEDAILRINGIKDKEAEKPRERSIVCKRCDTINIVGSTYCSKCGCVVDALTALKLEEKEKQEDKFLIMAKDMLARMMKENPEKVMEMMVP